MIEKAARVMCDAPQDSLPRWDASDPALRAIYMHEAQMVLDAILPRVTTVKELEALPELSALVFQGGPFSLLVRVNHGRLRGELWVGSFHQAIAELGELTVVWQP